MVSELPVQLRCRPTAPRREFINCGDGPVAVQRPNWMTGISVSRTERDSEHPQGLHAAQAHGADRVGDGHGRGGRVPRRERRTCGGPHPQIPGGGPGPGDVSTGGHGVVLAQGLEVRRGAEFVTPQRPVVGLWRVEPGRVDHLGQGERAVLGQPLELRDVVGYRRCGHAVGVVEGRPLRTKGRLQRHHGIQLALAGGRERRRRRRIRHSRRRWARHHERVVRVQCGIGGQPSLRR